MKPIYKVLIAILIILYLGTIAFILKRDLATNQYCGIVTSMYRTNAGYRVNAKAHVIFYCDSLKRKVDVTVSNNTYANIVPGQSVCFNLSERELND